jgi:nitrite reductase/ring-hydroxylating ferredoxin subunit
MAWTPVASCDALEQGDVVAVDCSGAHLALYRLEDGIFATSAACPHLGGSLVAGTVVNGYIECPVHYALFDIRTGNADGAITSQPLQTFRTKVEDDVIYVDLTLAEERMP